MRNGPMLIAKWWVSWKVWCLALGGQKRVLVSHKLVLEEGQWLLILQLLSWLVWIQISLRFNSWLVL